MAHDDTDALLPGIHLLSPTDLEPEVAAAEVVRADGSRQLISATLLAAIDHLTRAAAAERSALIRPLARRQWLVEAADITDLGERGLRNLVAQGRLPIIPSAVGDMVDLRDVVPLDQEFRARRDQIVQDMFEQTFADPELDEHDHGV
ncbi:MAG: hypothetical protein ACK5MT_01420 [Actinomycetales bacterium]